MTSIERCLSRRDTSRMDTPLVEVTVAHVVSHVARIACGQPEPPDGPIPRLTR
ncbi:MULTISPECIES: hypothetical protein [unclassified Streptomyces]|uniref:hypothetical protein n=1 Tax=unclassified Streptomyces TaxID=2593676 RepID=UPI0036E64C16